MKNDRVPFLTTVSGLPERGSLKFHSSKEINSSRFSLGFETLDRKMFKPEKCYDLLCQSGVKYARCQTGWSRCETEKGRYDFSWLDEVVDNLIERSIEPWFNVSYGNKLYMDDIKHESAVGCVPLYYGEEAIKAWENYVLALSEHFKNRVNYYEIWNESNHPSFWYPKGVSPVDYTRLVKISAKSIRNAQSDAMIAACIATPDEKFIFTCLDEGIGDVIQAFSIHPYHGIPEDIYFPVESVKVKEAFEIVPENIQYAAAVRNIRYMFSKKAPHVELWQGECGCPAHPEGHADSPWMRLYNMDELKQSKWVLRRLLTDLHMGMDRISYFHATDLMEQAYRQADGEAKPSVNLGLIKGLQYTPKQAYTAFQGICTLFDENTTVQPLSFRAGMARQSRCESKLPVTSLQVLSYVRKGYPLYAYYLPEDVQLEMTVRNDFWIHGFNETDEHMDNPVLIDLLQNKVFDLSAKNAGSGQSFDWSLDDLPLSDYPLIITESKAISGELK